mmetsp:Transcript_24426/g.57717  ORF Transcript_24426/g.57717 Transcript_24426/m.57717 type:complete len:270 (+) Transcript_24426:1142-1951(+)
MRQPIEPVVEALVLQARRNDSRFQTRNSRVHSPHGLLPPPHTVALLGNGTHDSDWKQSHLPVVVGMAHAPQGFLFENLPDRNDPAAHGAHPRRPGLFGPDPKNVRLFGPLRQGIRPHLPPLAVPARPLSDARIPPQGSRGPQQHQRTRNVHRHWRLRIAPMRPRAARGGIRHENVDANRPARAGQDGWLPDAVCRRLFYAGRIRGNVRPHRLPGIAKEVQGGRRCLQGGVRQDAPSPVIAIAVVIVIVKRKRKIARNTEWVMHGMRSFL